MEGGCDKRVKQWSASSTIFFLHSVGSPGSEADGQHPVRFHVHHLQSGGQCCGRVFIPRTVVGSEGNTGKKSVQLPSRYSYVLNDYREPDLVLQLLVFVTPDISLKTI